MLRVPRKFTLSLPHCLIATGSTLFPMNALPADLASVKSSAEKKYSWRSEVMDGVVPGIDVSHIQPCFYTTLFCTKLHCTALNVLCCCMPCVGVQGTILECCM